jgi:hypothetical protein
LERRKNEKKVAVVSLIAAVRFELFGVGRPAAAGMAQVRVWVLLLVLVLVPGAPAAAQAPATAAAPGGSGLVVATIVEGSAVLIRQSTRYALVEGVRLGVDDLVETARGGHVQLEFADGVMLSLADGARVMLQPRWAVRRAGVAPRAYLLEGWAKLTLPPNSPVPASALWLGPGLGLMRVSAASASPDKPAVVVTQLQKSDYAVFVEAGGFRLADRADPQRSWSLAGHHFVSRQGEGKVQQDQKPAPEFVAALPAPFRDALPARVDRFAARVVVPKPLGDLSYAEASPWLHAETALRLHLVERWRGRVGDPSFKAALQSHLGEHPEWEPVLFPERAAERMAERAAERSAERAASRAAQASH